MAHPAGPPTVKLLCGMLSAEASLLDEAAEALRVRFGPSDLTGETMNFDFTHYYDGQMGSPLVRRFVAFAGPFGPERLAPAKRATNAVEAAFASRAAGGPPRPLNLDVGYVEPSKLVLASMKNFSHRIYLGAGVYAEVTLRWEHGRWQALPWTFPDFASGRYDEFLSAARKRLVREGRP